MLHGNDSAKHCLMQTNRRIREGDTEGKKRVCTSENSSEDDGSSRVSGAAKTLFVNEEEGLLRTEELMLPWVELEDGSSESRESFCLVGEDEEEGLEEEGNVNDVTEETAIGFSNQEPIFLLLLPLNAPLLFASKVIQYLIPFSLFFFNWWM